MPPPGSSPVTTQAERSTEPSCRTQEKAPSAGTHPSCAAASAVLEAGATSCARAGTGGREEQGARAREGGQGGARQVSPGHVGLPSHDAPAGARGPAVSGPTALSPCPCDPAGAISNRVDDTREGEKNVAQLCVRDVLPHAPREPLRAAGAATGPRGPGSEAGFRGRVPRPGSEIARICHVTPAIGQDI